MHYAIFEPLVPSILSSSGVNCIFSGACATPCPPSDHNLDNYKMVVINPVKRENTMPVWQEGKKNQVFNKQLTLRYLLNLFTQAEGKV